MSFFTGISIFFFSNFKCLKFSIFFIVFDRQTKQVHNTTRPYVISIIIILFLSCPRFSWFPIFPVFYACLRESVQIYIRVFSCFAFFPVVCSRVFGYVVPYQGLTVFRFFVFGKFELSLLIQLSKCLVLVCF